MVPAAGAVDYTNKDTFWNWVAGSGGIVQDVVGLACGSACPSSDDGHHHAKSYLKGTKDGVYRCICTYCGASFNAYASDLDDAYTKHVKSLPARGYGSDGSLYVSSNHEKSFVRISSLWYACPHSKLSSDDKVSSTDGTLLCGVPTVFRAASSSGLCVSALQTNYSFNCLVDGTYSWASGYAATGSMLLKDSSSMPGVHVQ